MFGHWWPIDSFAMSRTAIPCFFASLFLLASCQQKAWPRDEGYPTIDWIVSYGRGGCFGECPVFELYILRKGKALLFAKHNLLRPGWYADGWSLKMVRRLVHPLRSPEVWTKAADTLPQIAELPSLHLAYKQGKTIRQWSVENRLSPSMEQVLLHLDDLVVKAHWIPTDLRPRFPSAISDVLIIQFKPGVLPEVWLSEHLDLGLRLDRTLARRTGHYRFRLTGLLPANDVFQHVRRDADVLGASWDYSLSPRGR